MHKLRIALLIILFSSFTASQAQISLRDSTFAFPFASAHFSFQWPGGNMANLYGQFQTVGPAFTYKTGNNWLFGASWSYLFGNKINNIDSILKPLQTSEGGIIDGNGVYAPLSVSMSGHYINAQFGKILTVFPGNSNAGLMLMGSVGYMWHKILYEDHENTIPQLKGDYGRGYDRLSGGPTISQFIGLVYFGRKKVTNFYGGLELTQGWKKGLRDYQFDLFGPDDVESFEFSIGLKVGWIIPVYRDLPVDEYYY